MTIFTGIVGNIRKISKITIFHCNYYYNNSQICYIRSKNIVVFEILRVCITIPTKIVIFLLEHFSQRNTDKERVIPLGNGFD